MNIEPADSIDLKMAEEDLKTILAELLQLGVAPRELDRLTRARRLAMVTLTRIKRINQSILINLNE